MKLKDERSNDTELSCDLLFAYMLGVVLGAVGVILISAFMWW